MSSRTARHSAMAFVFAYFCSFAHAQEPPRRPNLNAGDAVVTGFSGTVAPDPAQQLPPGKAAVDLTFIDPDGVSARVLDVARPGFVWDGAVFDAPRKLDLTAKEIGQVFGVAIDTEPTPSIYLGATSVFGLNIVSRGRDGLPERRKTGGPGTGWMPGQFGVQLQGGPGSVYKVDGASGVVSLFAEIMLDGVPNPGPALGNLAYDPAHKQLFVSDLSTGMVHRFSIVDGSELGPPFDHGTAGRAAGKLPPVPFDPSKRANIANARFKAGDSGTWGFTAPARRVWGLAVHGGRLFYSVGNGDPTDGPQIWSAGIHQDGSIADATWELDVPAQPGPYPISDIAFSEKGAMILAQRAPLAAAYDYSAFTTRGEPRVLRYWRESPDDPNTSSRWIAEPEEYAVGLPDPYRNTNGGVDLGYGYRQDGTLTTSACEYTIWTTGQQLRDAAALRAEAGVRLLVNGLQASPAGPVRDFNTPPTSSYFVDYDGRDDDARYTGHLGGIRIVKVPCSGPAANYGGPGYPGEPPYIFVEGEGGGGGGCIGRNCGPSACPPGTELRGRECVPPPESCEKPLVFIPGVGCACPKGTELRGRECVPPPESCEKPLVWNGRECVRPPESCEKPLVFIPGVGCACPKGTELRGRECVRPPPSCKPPLVWNGKDCVRPPPPDCRRPRTFIPGVGCACPKGTEWNGRACVKPKPDPKPKLEPKLRPQPKPLTCPQGFQKRRGTCVEIPEKPQRPPQPERPSFSPGDILDGVGGFIGGGGAGGGGDQRRPRKPLQPEGGTDRNGAVPGLF